MARLLADAHNRRRVVPDKRSEKREGAAIADETQTETSVPVARVQAFYIDHLEAVWMMKKHGMRFRPIARHMSSPIYEMLADFETGEIVIERSVNTGRIYVHPDSMTILDPRLGDIVEFIGGRIGEMNRKFSVELARQACLATVRRIIHRDGVAFFYPHFEQTEPLSNS